MKNILSKFRGLLTPPPLDESRANNNKGLESEPSTDPIVTEEPVEKQIEEQEENLVEEPIEQLPLDTIKEQWQRYETWLGEHFDQGLKNLNPGVTEGHLTILERTLNNELPSDYRDWLKIHNGQRADSTGLLYGNELLQVYRLLEEWFSMKKSLVAGEFSRPAESDPKGAIKPEWWNLNWLPVSADGAGNFVCIDLSPGEDGVVGQIINFEHATARRQVLANSFKDYISAYLDEIEVEKYTYSESKNALIPSNDT